MPYALDLVRLAASAVLARPASRSDDDLPSARAICRAIADGYARGLDEPAPIVLERVHPVLRRKLLLTGDDRREFWHHAEKWRKKPKKPSPAFADALLGALPPGYSAEVIARRSAGTGSLGRPRFVVQGDWRGGWVLSHPGDPRIHIEAIATGRARATDPHYRVVGDILVRRFSPNSRKIEAGRHPGVLLAPGMLRLMGLELAKCHVDDASARPASRADLRARDPDWLHQAALTAASFVSDEQRAYARKD